MSRPIYVFVRHCFVSSNSVNKERPAWFTREKAFENLIATTCNDKNVHITVLLDSDDHNAREHFAFKYNLPIVVKKGGSDAHSFRNLLTHILDEQTKIPDDAIVYLLEDDYIHNQGWTTVLREAFDKRIADYVTLYDHPDKYDKSVYPQLQTELFTTQSCHWRSTPSTTNTYAMLFSTLKQDREVNFYYSVLKDRYTYDHAKFVHLQTQINRKLVSSIPGFSTHCESKYMSPCQKWQINNNRL